MAKKTLILSQAQLDEICGGNASYLDGFADEGGDLAVDSTNKISAEGSVDFGYPDKMTTDDMGDFLTNNVVGYANTRGMGVSAVKESKKSEWIKKNLSEESEHGNARLQIRNFGTTNGDAGKSYSATKQAVYRKNKAEKKLNSTNPIERQKAQATLNKMRTNWSQLDNAEAQYTSAKAADKTIQGAKPEGTKINSAPKNNGNGKAHTPKNGIIH